MRVKSFGPILRGKKKKKGKKSSEIQRVRRHARDSGARECGRGVASTRGLCSAGTCHEPSSHYVPFWKNVWRVVHQVTQTV